MSRLSGLVGSLLALTVVLALQGAGAAAPKPALSSPAYRGLATDVVGRLQDARPNGEVDGRFLVTLSMRGSAERLVNVVLQRVVGKGYAEQWDANPGTSPSILAVFLNGRRLNPTDRLIDVRIPARATVRLDLRANDLGVFAPGERYRIVAVFTNFVEARTQLTLPGRRAVVAATFEGRGSDVVGRGNDFAPNGEADAHVRATLDVKGGWRVIQDVLVRRQNEQGSPEVEGWDANTGTSFQPLAIYLDGRRLQPGPLFYPVYATIDPARGPVRLDLYGNDPDPGLFRPPQIFRVTVIFTDHMIAKETSTIVRP